MRRQFSWEYFPTSLLSSIVYSEKTKRSLQPRLDIDSKEVLLPFMDRIAPRPDQHFIRRYRSELEEHFLKGSTHLVQVIRTLEKRKYHGVKLGSMDENMETFKRLRLTNSVLTLIEAELLRKGYVVELEEEASFFITPKTIDLTSSIANSLPLHAYQEDAANRLRQHFMEDSRQAGILVMPTGSGKTRVATRFLLQDMVAAGWQVIWMAHRAMLLDQAADAIYQAAPIVKLSNPSKQRFKMVCVSGSHSTIMATEKNDDVILGSVQSLVRRLDFLPAILGDRVLVVVDEAHHTVAPSYRSIIKKIQTSSREMKLLGLTATPVRMQEAETARLMKLFDHQIIHSIPMSKLIKNGTLAEPNFEHVETNVDFDTTISLDEKKYIRQWGEPSPVLMEQMAQVKERNTLIVEQYIKNRQRYGKTLIFALNATHCISLCEELQKRDVRCDYLYSGHQGNDSKIKRFVKGELDVLVNINIMTEGSDVPDIQTVMLTRPTSSDVLLMQMIGRGMRGAAFGGTEKVNIVDFVDTWGSFANWLNPQFLLLEQDSEVEGETDSSSPRPKPKLVPWGMFRDLLDSIHTQIAWGEVQAVTTLPVGWYDIIDEEGNDGQVLVFQSQLQDYQAFWKARNRWSETEMDAQCVLMEYFTGFGPSPSLLDVKRLMDSYKTLGELPHLFPFLDRKEIDAAQVATRLMETNVGINDLEKEIRAVYDKHNELINSLYGGLREYEQRVFDFIRYPKGIVPFGSRVLEIEELPKEIDTTPTYDLKELTEEVVHQMFDGSYGELPLITWTRRPLRSYYGQYTYPDADGQTKARIKMNSILNSKDVPREAVKYILYHELLHRDYTNHNAAFREKERQYPNWTELERFLDFRFDQFDLHLAM